MSIVGMVALLVAALVLTYSVFSRYLFKAATDWQDEIAVFSSSARCFSRAPGCRRSAATSGSRRIASILPPRVNRVRVVLVDVMSLAFCAFFAWKSWTLFHEAWVDKMTTSSTFAPPLTIPYGLMALGMSLLVVELCCRSIGHFVRARRTMSAAKPAGAP